MAQPPHHTNWLDGSPAPPCAAAEEERIQITDPATEAVIATIDATPAASVADIVTRSLHHFQSGSWSRSDASTRFGVLSSAASLLRARIPEFADLETLQTGRPIREMRTQLARVPEWLEYFAALARTEEGRVTPFKGPVTNTLVRQPIGVVALVTPWNHPLLIATKKIAAALAAGNVVIVKPSELAPLSLLKLAELLGEAGLPGGTLQVVLGTGRETGRFLCEDQRLARIDLTGGIETYRAIAPVAGRNLVPVTAELGGKAPVCVFPSMQVERAVQAALFAAFIASGQTCVTGSRILVHGDIYEEFVALLEERTKRLRIGDPKDARTQIGAVISQSAVERCAGFVSRAEADGGRVLCGGKPTQVDGKGFFFEPTLVETRADSELACNEVFGPVIAVIKCDSEEHIVEVANGTAFALGASVWTNDFAQAHRVADRIEAGIVWINAHHLNDPSSPWGGFKESGIGKENGREAYESYTRLKSTVINYGVAPTWFDDEVENARYG